MNIAEELARIAENVDRAVPGITEAVKRLQIATEGSRE